MATSYKSQVGSLRLSSDNDPRAFSHSKSLSSLAWLHFATITFCQPRNFCHFTHHPKCRLASVYQPASSPPNSPQLPPAPSLPPSAPTPKNRTALPPSKSATPPPPTSPHKQPAIVSIPVPHLLIPPPAPALALGQPPAQRAAPQLRQTKLGR